jgi:hypothetical protein
VIRTLAAIVLLTSALGSAADLPRPIGSLSDYGSVLDRHGRDRINALIEDARARFGIDIFILVSWENPLPNAERFGAAVLEAWGLDVQEPVILAVFVKAHEVWEHSVIGNRALADPSLPAKLHSEIRGLVEHQRIEEAMVTLIDRLGRHLDEPAARSAAPPERRALGGWIALGALIVSGGLIWGIHRRVCPRCGRLLRAGKRSSDPRAAPGHRVYYCSSCGFRR